MPGTSLEKKLINIKQVSQSTDYIPYKIHFNQLNSEVSAPFSFTRKTNDGAVVKAIKIPNNITIFEANKYKMNLSFFINR